MLLVLTDVKDLKPPIVKVLIDYQYRSVDGAAICFLRQSSIVTVGNGMCKGLFVEYLMGIMIDDDKKVQTFMHVQRSTVSRNNFQVPSLLLNLLLHKSF